jgi:hypothetical protein
MHDPVSALLLVLRAFCQFSFDRTERSLETLDDIDHLEWIGDPSYSSCRTSASKVLTSSLRRAWSWRNLWHLSVVLLMIVPYRMYLVKCVQGMIVGANEDEVIGYRWCG